MNDRMNRLVLILVILFSFALNEIEACSMYKVTTDGKTMVGTNHDDWFTTPKIWFENANDAQEYGAAFTGARQMSGDRTAPQSGMNTAGLCFSRLASYYPPQENPFKGRLPISDEVDYLTNILHQCATVQEVRKHIERYDHSYFIEGVFIYIDSSGDYLIVEPYQLIEGHEPQYVLSNFCPSITDNEQARKLERYRNGEDFLRTHAPQASLDYCRAMSDSMHVCRKRLGDGTLISSIWDTKNKGMELFFYHDYDTSVHFDLLEELAEGDHSLSIPELFPKNAEFERLVNYKTPSNTVELRIALVILAGLLALFSLLLGISLIRNHKSEDMPILSLVLMILMNLSLIAYTLVLITNKSIFYFDAPYVHYSSNLITASSYLPFALLLLMGYLSIARLMRIKSDGTQRWPKSIVLANTLVYLILVIGFAYWGLYSI